MSPVRVQGAGECPSSGGVALRGPDDPWERKITRNNATRLNLRKPHTWGVRPVAGKPGGEGKNFSRFFALKKGGIETSCDTKKNDRT